MRGSRLDAGPRRPACARARRRHSPRGPAAWGLAAVGSRRNRRSAGFDRRHLPRMPVSGLTALFRVQLAFGQAGSLKAALSRLFCRLRILQMFLEEGNEPGERFADRFGLAADQEPLTKRFLDRLDCEPKALGEAGQERDIHADELAGRFLVETRG